MEWACAAMANSVTWTPYPAHESKASNHFGEETNNQNNGDGEKDSFDLEKEEGTEGTNSSGYWNKA